MDRSLRILLVLSFLGGASWVGAVVAATLPDPTRPAGYVAGRIEIPIDVVDWVVNGITISSRSRSAILNGAVVVPGQQVADPVVVDIEPNAVILDYNGERISVRLRSQIVKHPVSN